MSDHHDAGKPVEDPPLDVKKLELECELLRVELAKARTPRSFLDTLMKNATLLTMIGGIVAFTFSVRQYSDQQRANRKAAADRGIADQQERAAAAEREQESRDREFMKPLWEKQVELYFEASTVAATLAIVDNPEQWAAAESRFWILYQGPLCIVEPPAVGRAMIDFGVALNARDKKEMIRLSRALASACQEAISTGSKTRLMNFNQGKYDYRH